MIHRSQSPTSSHYPLYKRQLRSLKNYFTASSIMRSIARAAPREIGARRRALKHVRVTFRGVLDHPRGGYCRAHDLSARSVYKTLYGSYEPDAHGVAAPVARVSYARVPPYSCTVVQLYSRTAVQSYSCTVVQCTVVQLYSRTLYSRTLYSRTLYSRTLYSRTLYSRTAGSYMDRYPGMGVRNPRAQDM
jgi:hypothetical protein